VARGIFGNIFENLRASCKYVGCGLILEKMRGLSAKCREMGFSRNYFVEEKPVDQVNGSVDHTDPVHHGPAAIVARRSSLELSLRPLWLAGTRRQQLGRGSGARGS
jgi:hypothetical protein